MPDKMAEQAEDTGITKAQRSFTKTIALSVLAGAFISLGAKFWLQVLTDLQNRGLEDIFIASIDNLSGFADTVQASFPRTEVQLCIVHQIRNSQKNLSYKDV